MQLPEEACWKICHVEDMTAKCQAFSQNLVQLEEGKIFEDSDEDEPYFRAQPESNPDIRIHAILRKLLE